MNEQTNISKYKNIVSHVVDLDALDNKRPYLFAKDGTAVQLHPMDEKALMDDLGDEDGRFAIFEQLQESVKIIEDKHAKSKVDAELPDRVRKSKPASGANEAKIEIHMRQVFNHIIGRRSTEQANILGLYAFGANVNKVVQGYKKGCPYAGWMLWQIENQIKSLRQEVADYHTSIRELIESKHLGMEYKPFTSSRPTVEKLEFNAIHAHQVASILMQYDTLLRELFPYLRNRFVTYEEFGKNTETIGRHFRRLFVTPSSWFYVGKEACDAKDTVYLGAATRMGEIPNDFLTGELKPEWVV